MQELSSLRHIDSRGISENDRGFATGGSVDSDGGSDGVAHDIVADGGGSSANSLTSGLGGSNGSSLGFLLLLLFLFLLSSLSDLRDSRLGTESVLVATVVATEGEGRGATGLVVNLH